jgi:hypothetical protein
MTRISSRKIAFLILICACCVDPFDASLSGNKTLVVEGLILDQAGPQTVTRSYSSSLGVGEFTRELASGAVVTIVDNTGVKIQLTEVSAGVYQTDSADIAQQGKIYFIRIVLNNEIMNPVRKPFCRRVNWIAFFLNCRQLLSYPNLKFMPTQANCSKVAD